MSIIRFRPAMLCLALLILILSSLQPTLRAQTATEGAIDGTVQDPSGAAIAGAVTIHNVATNAEVALTT